MKRVIHFEIQADKPERAIEFYEKVFGWKFEKLEGPGEYWLISTGPEDQPGINGGLMRTSDLPKGTINAIDAASVDEFVKTVVENRGKVVTPKTAISDLGYYAYCEDTEGMFPEFSRMIHRQNGGWEDGDVSWSHPHPAPNG